MDTDSCVVKAWGESETRVKEINGEERGISGMLSIIKINLNKLKQNKSDVNKQTKKGVIITIDQACSPPPTPSIQVH